MIIQSKVGSKTKTCVLSYSLSCFITDTQDTNTNPADCTLLHCSLHNATPAQMGMSGDCYHSYCSVPCWFQPIWKDLLHVPESYSHHPVIQCVVIFRDISLKMKKLTIRWFIFLGQNKLYNMISRRKYCIVFFRFRLLKMKFEIFRFRL